MYFLLVNFYHYTIANILSKLNYNQRVPYISDSIKYEFLYDDLWLNGRFSLLTEMNINNNGT